MRRTILGALTLLTASGPVTARPVAHAQASRGERRVAWIAEALLRTARIPSLSLAVIRDDSLDYRAAFGLADLEARSAWPICGSVRAAGRWCGRTGGPGGLPCVGSRDLGGPGLPAATPLDVVRGPGANLPGRGAV